MPPPCSFEKGELTVQKNNKKPGQEPRTLLLLQVVTVT